MDGSGQYDTSAGLAHRPLGRVNPEDLAHAVSTEELQKTHIRFGDAGMDL
jgi:hypothetical protein